MTRKILDTTGLMCPLPVLKARKELSKLQDGSTLEVKSTDPASVMDFGVFCEDSGHELLEQYEGDGILTFVIRCKKS